MFYNNLFDILVASRFSTSTNTSSSAKSSYSDGHICNIANIPVPFHTQSCCSHKKSQLKKHHHCSDKSHKHSNYNNNKMNACAKYLTAKHNSLTKEIFDYSNHTRNHVCHSQKPDKKYNISLAFKNEDKPVQKECSVSMMTIMKEEDAMQCRGASCSWSGRTCCSQRYYADKCCKYTRRDSGSSSKDLCSNRFIQVVIAILILIMALW